MGDNSCQREAWLRFYRTITGMPRPKHLHAGLRAEADNLYHNDHRQGPVESDPRNRWRGNIADALRAKWADPVYRENMLQARKAARGDLKRRTTGEG